MEMTRKEFDASLTAEHPPEDLPAELKALWYDRNGDWKRAHELVQDESSQESAWVHAYLHRKEGDLSNASYWYQRCGKPVCSDTLDREWERITSALL